MTPFPHVNPLSQYNEGGQFYTGPEFGCVHHERARTPDDGADVELAWTNLRGVPRMHRQLWRGICRRGEENVSRGAKKLHPNQKPVALMDWCLQQAGVGADALVVDTHMGSGTTALACLRRGVRFVGMEIDPAHFETALQRLRNEPANVAGNRLAPTQEQR